MRSHLHALAASGRARWPTSVAVAAVIVVAGCSRGDGVHADDMEHPLSFGGMGVEISVHPPEDRNDGESWSATFGSFLPCVAKGDEPLTITEIRWSSASGLEPESVVTYLRTVDLSTEMPIGSMKGTPLEPLDAEVKGLVQENAEGYVVSVPCSETRSPTGLADEILFAVTAGDTGGHIGDLRFTYETANGKTHTLENHSSFYVCGSAVPDEFGCP